MIEIMTLYILLRYDTSIYRLKKIIEEYFFAYTKVSYGTISPALKRLEKMGCVEFSENMSKGGMKTKKYSITQTGKKHLINLLLTWENNNPYHILQEAKIILYCSDVLNTNEQTEFSENLLNILELHKVKLEKGLKNEYISLNNLQINIIKNSIKEVNELINLI